MLLRCLILVTLFSTKSSAQESIANPKNVIDAELCFPAPIISLNYERLLTPKNDESIFFRIGLGSYPDWNLIFLIPHGLYVDYKLSYPVFFELGINGAYVLYEDEVNIGTHNYIYPKRSGYWLLPSIGVRWLDRNAITARVSFSPLFEIAGNAIGKNVVGNLTFGIGYAF